MRLIADQDERDLASMARGLLAKEARAGERLPDTLWKALSDSGILGLPIPTEYRGSGGTLNDVAVFCIEAGRALCSTLVHSTLLASFTIDTFGTAAQRERWLPRFASGDLRATTALWHPRDAAVAPVLRAEPDANGWRISGAADYVLDGDLADVIVVAADAPGRQLCFVVALDDPRLSLEPVELMGGHSALRVVFDGVGADHPAASFGDGDLRRVANTAVTLLSLDLVGVGEAVLARTVDYTIMRRQFGRPIASFQAAQHLVANMHIALAAARLAARSAAFWIGQGRDAIRETAVARMQSAAAAKRITLDAHQLHGGMGYVIETDLHRWSERARVLSTLGGSVDVAAGWLQAEMGLGCPTV